LANLQLAITLLFIIGIAVAIGTFIEQDQSLSFYKENYPIENPFFGFLDWKFIIFFNLNKLYSAFWFLSLLAFFALSLLACTFTTQLPALKKFRLWNFLTSPSQFKNFALTDKLKKNFYNTFTYTLSNDNYHIFCQGKKNMLIQVYLAELDQL
jgi:cytochrome c biogenesis protein